MKDKPSLCWVCNRKEHCNNIKANVTECNEFRMDGTIEAMKKIFGKYGDKKGGVTHE